MEISEKVKSEILKAAQNYIKYETADVFRSEVEKAIDMEDWESLYDRFYTSLAFGTAGMRGVIGGGTNRINTFMVKKVSQGLADFLKEKCEKPTVVIAYDSRLFSNEFALSASLVLTASGVKVYLYDTLHPVPMLSFAVRYLRASAGIVITASHNPSKYNGYKVYWSDGGQVTPPEDQEIADKANSVCGNDIRELTEKEARDSGLLLPVPDDVDEAYYRMVLTSIRRPALVQNSPITVAYTPLHGTGNIPLRHLLGELGIRTVVVEDQELPDGNFPTVKLPNPESAEAMSKVISLAKLIKADIVLGTDPDADRLGVAIPKDGTKTEYSLLTGNQIATLLVDYLLMTNKDMGRNPGKRPLVVKSIVTTDLVKKITEGYDGDIKDVLTGFKYIAEQIEKTELGDNGNDFFLFGCEESYGFLTVPYVRDKDAVSSAIVAVEMMCYLATQGLTLQDRLDEIYRTYGYSTECVFSRDFEGAEGKIQMQSIMSSFRALKEGDRIVKRKIESITDLLSPSSGLPKSDVVIISFTSGEKMSVRPSGTEPKIKFYIFLQGERAELESNKDSILEEFKAAF